MGNRNFVKKGVQRVSNTGKGSQTQQEGGEIDPKNQDQENDREVVKAKKRSEAGYHGQTKG